MAGKYSPKPAPAAKKSRADKSRAEKSRVTPESIASETEPLNHVENQILQWFRTVRFRKTAFGGVDKADLWKKMGELNDLFHQAISAERARYEGQMQAYAKATTEKLESLEAENAELRRQYEELYRAWANPGFGPRQGGE